MQEKEIELSVGDCLQIGPHTVTIIDIDGPEVSFRIDHEHEEDCRKIQIEQFEEAIVG